MSLFDFLKKPAPETQALRAAADARFAQTVTALSKGRLPETMRARLEASRDRAVPWTSTMTPAELLIMRTHGIAPIAAVSSTCWLHYGRSWTEGHAEGWNKAIGRLRAEAKAAGANAVLDVKMRTIPLQVETSMDFSLVGTAVRIEGLPPSEDPVIATVPALEFARMLDADIVPTGIAVGAHFDLLDDWRGQTDLRFMGNMESKPLSALWESVRRQAHAQLRKSAEKQGTGALAHINFSQMFEIERDKQPKQYLARHIVIATVIDAKNAPDWALRYWPGINGEKLPGFSMVVDMHAGKTPLKTSHPHHQSYALSAKEGAI
jgi:uncharacterized protein YbjQ (UPF0145 family)